MSCRGVVAIVAGGGSGLGRAAAERLIRLGGRVVLADLNPATEKVAHSMHPERAIFSFTDVTNEDHVKAALDLAEEKFHEPVSAAVNCAGILYAGKTVNRKGVAHPQEAFEKVLKVNVGGSFNVARMAAERMAKREPDSDGGKGVIINTASIAAYDGQAGQSAYSASKGALVGLTLPMARDLAPLGIRVCTIAPGIFDTPMMASASEDLRASLASSIPFPPRLGHGEDYAKLVEAILLNPYLNGETIRLDGATRMKA